MIAALLIAVIIVMAACAVGSNECQRHAKTGGPSGEQYEQEAFWCPSTWSPEAAFALGAIIVGGVQAGLFWWQLGLIRDSMKDSARAADAARDAADISRKSVELADRHGQIGLRAYVHIFLREDSKMRLPVDQKPWIPVGMINAGQTPANNVRVITNIVPAPFPLTHPLPDLTETGQGSCTSLYPGQKDIVLTPTADSELSVKDLTSLEPIPMWGSSLPSSLRLYVYGKIIYDDVFGRRWSANFRLCTAGMMTQNASLNWCADGNYETELND